MKIIHMYIGEFAKFNNMNLIGFSPLCHHRAIGRVNEGIYFLLRFIRSLWFSLSLSLHFGRISLNKRINYIRVCTRYIIFPFSYCNNTINSLETRLGFYVLVHHQVICCHGLNCHGSNVAWLPSYSVSSPYVAVSSHSWINKSWNREEHKMTFVYLPNLHDSGSYYKRTHLAKRSFVNDQHYGFCSCTNQKSKESVFTIELVCFTLANTRKLRANVMQRSASLAPRQTRLLSCFSSSAPLFTTLPLPLKQIHPLHMYHCDTTTFYMKDWCNQSHASVDPHSSEKIQLPQHMCKEVIWNRPACSSELENPKWNR